MKHLSTGNMIGVFSFFCLLFIYTEMMIYLTVLLSHIWSFSLYSRNHFLLPFGFTRCFSLSSQPPPCCCSPWIRFTFSFWITVHLRLDFNNKNEILLVVFQTLLTCIHILMYVDVDVCMCVCVWVHVWILTSTNK